MMPVLDDNKVRGGGHSKFLKAGEQKGGIDHLCLAMTLEKTKDDDEAGATL
jgi:hypothetical protein